MMKIWLVEHPPVYTQGIACKPEHLLYNNGIPVIRTDRGGQITYHGPGQIVAYLLLDMRRLKLGVRELVRKMEGAVVDLLRDYDVRCGGPRGCSRSVCGWCKNRRIGAENKKRLLLPWAGSQCRYGPDAVCRDKPVRISRVASNPNQGSRNRRWAGGIKRQSCEKLKARLFNTSSLIAESS